MYINRIKKMKYLIFGFIQLVIGVILGLCALFGLWEILTEFEKVESFWEAYLFFGIAGGLFLVCGIRNKRMVDNCNAFNEAFKKDGDGIVDLREISLRSGMTEEVVMKRLRCLIKKRCLVHVSIDFEGERPIIVLEDHDASLFAKNVSGGYTEVSCPNCGASCRVKEGFVGKCSFCGGYIKENSRNGLKTENSGKKDVDRDRR